ncbi:MAG TPA: parvulin peptidyl-prolyl isomerase [Methylophaga aminisulfidivorans]|uniref:SurA N-terminal domain-containing protein n=1 Tax=Methylophaga TaxID=40222 RepID=UPI00176D1B1A|nr:MULTISPECIES: SurA N-terminal domain-containing protein [Methylophaga]HIC45483.1 parvulin peptidyl-prolyl isomerase [Methylophaga sp.]HIM40462.1 parvulin peptidyl-prolyl isomerase [Methylophaga aminisulfidivorans]
MLHFIRNHAQGWIAWFIVGLISIPFALWGINSYLSGASTVVVAEVNGSPITQTELQTSLQQYRDRMRSMMGDQFDPAMFDNASVKKDVLDGLIDQRLLRDANQTLKQRISDAAVSQFIRSTPAFQRDGKFDSDYYGMVLARVGYTPAQYEAQLRADLLSQELTTNIQNSSIASVKLLNEALRLERQQRELAYGLVPIQRFVDKVNVDDEEVKQYYEDNVAAYTAPEQVKLNYIELSVDELAKGVQVNDDELKKFYADNQNQFVGPEQRRASHILIEGDDDAALEKIKAIQTRLENGEDFALLAKETSDDTGSAEKGGDLGFFGKDVMDPAFEEAAFALTNVGDVSEPVKTEFGYHLIKLTGIQKPEGKTFDQARDQVEKMYRRQQAESIFYDKAEQLANLSFENPDSLDVAAEALGLDIKTTESFTRTGTEAGVTSNKKVIDAAFSEDVLKNDLNSAVIELSDNDLIVVHKNKHIPETVLPFESVSPAIKQQLVFDKARKLAQDEGESVVEKVKSGESPESLLINWQAAEFYGRDAEKVSSQILQRAFTMPKPLSAPEYEGFSADNGNYVVIKLTAVKNGDIDDVTDEQKKALQQQLTSIYASAEVEAFIAQLRNDADIDIHQDALK